MPVAPSIFAPHASAFWTHHRCRIQLREKIMGGTPLKPDLIEGWLRKNMGVTTEEEVRLNMVRTLIELGAELDANETDMDKIILASKELAAKTETTGFKVDPAHGLYIEGRQVKAMLKESINCLFAGEVTEVQEEGKDGRMRKRTKKQGWGRTNKGARSFAAEHVFVEDERVYLGVREPTGLEFTVGHIRGPDGPQATIGYHQYVLQPVLEFTVMVDPVGEPEITEERWTRIWLHAQENGLGAMRSQGYGRFNVLQWERRNGKDD